MVYLLYFTRNERYYSRHGTACLDGFQRFPIGNLIENDRDGIAAALSNPLWQTLLMVVVTHRRPAT